MRAPGTNQFIAYVHVGGIKYYLGTYPNAITAARMHDWSARVVGRPTNFELGAGEAEVDPPQTDGTRRLL